MDVRITDKQLREAADNGMDAFLKTIGDAIILKAGGELNSDALALLTMEQATLWGYLILREEVMDGGFVQLIHNGYGPFFFQNPFAKIMKLWELRDFSKLMYKAGKLYYKYKDELVRDCTDDEFMALFEKFSEFDELDDSFVENEESITALIAHYVDEHLGQFVAVEQE